MYSLSQTEVQALHEFLDENVRIGFIRPSKAGHGAPILFIKKKGNPLRLCVDFRGLNRLMKKDRYPLPLISNLLDAPSVNVKLFFTWVSPEASLFGLFQLFVG